MLFQEIKKLYRGHMAEVTEKTWDVPELFNLQGFSFLLKILYLIFDCSQNVRGSESLIYHFINPNLSLTLLKSSNIPYP